MNLITKVRKWLTRWRATELEAARCPCGQRFLRPVKPHPDLKCARCEAAEMERWMQLAQIRGLS